MKAINEELERIIKLNGITNRENIYKDEYGLLPWENITEFKFKNLLFGSKMIIKTANNTYKFEINTSVIGCPWAKENAKHLKEINYFYGK